MTSPPTSAFLALWNGVNDPDLVPEYEAWHTFEHVPERVGLPGWHWARRYVATAPALGTCAAAGQPAYFTLYGLASLQALRTPAYQELLDHPTGWSARMRGVLSDFCREPCEAAAFLGHASAAFLATLRLRLPPGDTGHGLTRGLQALVDESHAVHAGWGQTGVDMGSGHPLDRAAPHGRQAGIDGPGMEAGIDAVVLLEHIRESALRAAIDRLAAGFAKAIEWRAPPAFFQIQSVVDQASLAHPLTSRQPARPDLRQRFQPADERP